MTDKNTVRSEVKSTLSTISKAHYVDYSLKIANKLYLEEEWKRAESTDESPIISAAGSSLRDPE